MLHGMDGSLERVLADRPPARWLICKGRTCCVKVVSWTEALSLGCA